MLLTIDKGHAVHVREPIIAHHLGFPYYSLFAMLVYTWILWSYTIHGHRSLLKKRSHYTCMTEKADREF